MFDLQNIRLATERNNKAVELKPSLAKGTDTARAQLSKDMRFDIDVNGIKISAEVPQQYGGNGTTPGSSAHALSSIICCTMVGYLIKFAEKNIPVSGLGIEVKGDWDKAIKYGYTGVRYLVTVDSNAPEVDIQQAIAESDASSFGLAVIQQPIETRREVRVTAAAG